MDPEYYGKYSLIITITLLINLVFYGGLIQAISRVFFQAFEVSDIKSLFQHTLRSFLYISLLVCLLSALIINYFQSLTFEKPTWFLIVIYSIIFSLIKVYDTFCNVHLANEISFAGSFVELIVKMVLVILLYSETNNSLNNILVILNVSSVCNLITLVYLFKEKKQSIKKEAFKKINWTIRLANIAMPASLWGLVYWLQQSSDKWLIGSYLSFEELGYYSVIYQLGYLPFMIIIGVIIDYLIPIYFSKNPNKGRCENELISKSINVSLILLALTLIVVFFSANNVISIINLFSSSNYQFHLNMFPVIQISAALFSIGQVFCVNLNAALMHNKVVVVRILTSISGLMFNYLGISLFGFDGLIFGMLLFSFCYAFSMIYLVINSRSKI